MPCDAPSAMPRAWTRRFVTQQGPQFARTGGLFFSRAATRVTETPSRRQVRRYPERGTLFSRKGTGVPLLSLKEDTMSVASQVNALSTDRRSARRPVRSATFDRAKACRMRAAPRSSATRRRGRSHALDRLSFRRSYDHGRPSWLTATARRSPPWSSNWPRTIRSS